MDGIEYKPQFSWQFTVCILWTGIKRFRSDADVHWWNPLYRVCPRDFNPPNQSTDLPKVFKFRLFSNLPVLSLENDFAKRIIMNAINFRLVSFQLLTSSFQFNEQRSLFRAKGSLSFSTVQWIFFVRNVKSFIERLSVKRFQWTRHKRCPKQKLDSSKREFRTNWRLLLSHLPIV